KMKLAAMEAMWETEPAPASFTLFGIPDQAARETHYAVRIPWVMGLIGTRSLDTPIPGIEELVDHARARIKDGIVAFDALQKIRAAGTAKVAPEVTQAFEQNGRNLGYALLLKRYVDDPRTATSAQIDKAAWDTVPQVMPMFLSFRIMVGLGFYFIIAMTVFFALSVMRKLDTYPWLLKVAVLSIPLPWIAAEVGWFVAEFGRQPWIIEGVLPTAAGVSSLGAMTVLLTIVGFALIYTVLIVIEMTLMVKAIRKGPEPDHQSETGLVSARLAPAE
ncbi:MAG: cytochrome d terminal oxidase subunit 1, partial [Rhizobiales bacterium 35-68-8]